jgi:hypothetical protein
MAKKRAGLDAMREKFGEALKGLTTTLHDSTETAKATRSFLEEAKDDIETALNDNEITLGGKPSIQETNTDIADAPPKKKRRK